MGFEVVPIDGKSHGGRQYGYMIRKGDDDLLYVTTGGTGPCWNISRAFDAYAMDDDPGAEVLHACYLDDLIGALQALRDSEAHQETLRRWE